MSRLKSNRYCVCSSCRGGRGRCESLKAFEFHNEVASRLLSNDSNIIKIHIAQLRNEEPASVNCHLVLLAHFSQVFDREIQNQLKKKNVVANIQILDNDLDGNDFQRMISWCYTGRVGDNDLYCGNMLERLWNMAVDLEMPLFANYCMRCLMTKYNHNSSTIGWWKAFRGNSASYQPHGLIYVQKHNCQEFFRARLLCFMQQLIEKHGPLSNSAINGVDKDDLADYERNWYKAVFENNDFKLWVGNHLQRVPDDADGWWVKLWDDFMIEATSSIFDVQWLQLSRLVQLKNPPLSRTTTVQFSKDATNKRGGKMNPFQRKLSYSLEVLQNSARSWQEPLKHDGDDEKQMAPKKRKAKEEANEKGAKKFKV